MPKKSKLRELLTPQFVESYACRMSDADAAEELGISHVPFWAARKRFKIKSYFERTGLRTRKSTGEQYEFYHYDERFFAEIDTPAKAYFLGLLAADGNISPRLTACRIALKEIDEDILESFRQHLGAGAPPLRKKVSRINDKENAPQKILVLSRIALVQDLAQWGITPDKSHSLKMTCPALEDKRLCANFLRGVWDGDGSVTERRFKVTTGSPQFAVQLKEMISFVGGNELRLTIERSEDRESLYSFAGYIQDADVLHAIFADPSPSMQRKRRAYELHWESRR